MKVQRQIRDKCIELFGLDKYRHVARTLPSNADLPPSFGRMKFWQESIIDRIIDSFPDSSLDTYDVCRALHHCDVHDNPLAKELGYSRRSFVETESFFEAMDELYPFGYSSRPFPINCCSMCKSECELWIAAHADECLLNANILARSFPEGFPFPDEFQLLCQADREFGYLGSQCFSLNLHDEDRVQKWFHTKTPVPRIAHFGSNTDGSMYCLWRSGKGTLPVVHLGVEGDPATVLAASPLEFMRLLAIGYCEIECDYLELPPRRSEEEAAALLTFQRMVVERFHTTIPETGADIVQTAHAEYKSFPAWARARWG